MSRTITSDAELDAYRDEVRGQLTILYQRGGAVVGDVRLDHSTGALIVTGACTDADKALVDATRLATATDLKTAIENWESRPR